MPPHKSSSSLISISFPIKFIPIILAFSATIRPIVPIPTIPFYYQHHPIEINTNQNIRAYVVNVLEFDAVNNFHLHGTLFHHYPAGTDTVPSGYNDMLTMSQGDRQILEFNYKYPGLYMFHAHNTEFSEKGWVSSFLVKENADDYNTQVEYDDII